MDRLNLLSRHAFTFQSHNSIESYDKKFSQPVRIAQQVKLASPAEDKCEFLISADAQIFENGYL